MSRIPYSGTKNASSWAFRAWLALKEQGVDFEERVVEIRKPQRYDNLVRIASRKIDHLSKLGIAMRPFLFVATFFLSTLLLAACGRNEPERAASDVAPAETQAPPAPRADTAPAPSPPIASDSAQPPAPPAPVVEGMYVIYSCDNGTEPKITFAGNLVKVELTVESEPVVLSARASATSMSDTYSDDALTLHRDGLGITLDLGGGKTTRCTESEASA